MSREGLSRLIEAKAPGVLRELRQNSKERKGSSQRIGGASLAYVVSANPGQFDWNGRANGPTGNPDYGLNQFIITCTSEVSETPLVDLAMTVFYASSGTNWEEYTFERSTYDSWNFLAPEIWYQMQPLPGMLNEPHKARFRVAIFARHNTYVAFKLQAIGTDDVAITVERTS